MKKTLLLAAMTAALGFASVPASASIATFADFTVDTSTVGGATVAKTFVADKLNGGYQEVVSINNFGQVTAAAYATFGSFFKNQGTGSVFGTGLGSTYAIYGVFNATAQVVSATQFNATGGTFTMYMDTTGDTIGTLGATGNISATMTNTADDYVLGTASIQPYGVGTVGVPTPAFEFLFTDFTLTTGVANGHDGDSFFVAPNPFFMKVVLDGNTVGLGTGAGNYTGITGGINLSYQEIPEPASLALVGLGLLGLAASRRRKSV